MVNKGSEATARDPSTFQSITIYSRSHRPRVVFKTKSHPPLSLPRSERHLRNLEKKIPRETHFKSLTEEEERVIWKKKKKKKKKPDRSQRIPIVHTGYANLLLPIGANLHLPNHSRVSPLLSRDPFLTSVSVIIDTTDTSRPLECYSRCQRFDNSVPMEKEGRE